MSHPLSSRHVEASLNTAFETNDLQRICRAVNSAIVQSGGVVEIARASELDRVTLYRAFSLEKGLALENMIKVLRVLGFRLIVEVRRDFVEDKPSRETKRAAAYARRFTAAFKSGEVPALVEVFRQTLQALDNVSEFAGKTIRTREALYRVFTKNPMPRFSTILSFLNALECQLAVRRLSKPELPDSSKTLKSLKYK